METNLTRLGGDLKAIQEILRHALIATTADIYVKEVSEQAVEAMNRLEQHVEKELKKERKTNSESAYSAVNLQQATWAVLQNSNGTATQIKLSLVNAAGFEPAHALKGLPERKTKDLRQNVTSCD